MNYFKSILLVILLVSFVACDKVADQLANDRTVLLTKRLWTFESITGFDDFGNQFAATFFTGMTYQFRADGTYTAIILGQSGNSTWEFNTDKTLITLEPGTSDAIEWTVVTLNETELKITFKDDDALTGVITIVFN